MLSNKWSGKFIDANGQQGTFEIEADSGLNKQASWMVCLAVQHGEPPVLRGEFDVEVDENKMLVRSSQTPAKDQKLQWEISLDAEKAGSFAKLAMLGRYTARSGDDRVVLTSGVLVLWQFAE